MLHVVHSLDLGGAETVVATLATRTDRRLFEPEVVALTRGGELEERIRREGIPIHVLNKRLGIDLGALGRLRRLIRDGDYSLIHTHNPQKNHWTILACLLLLRFPPIVFTQHSPHHPGRMPRWYPLLGALLGLRNRAIVGVCGLVTQAHRRIDPVNRRHYVTIYNGIEPPARLSEDQRRSLRREFGVPTEAIVLGNVGNLRPPKAQGDLLDALAQLAGPFPHVHAVIIGSGSLQEELEARARTLGISDRVHWLGRRDDVGRLLSMMDLFVLSSRSEGLPLAILEAISVKLPVVSTDVGGISEVIRPGETGELVPAAAPDALARAVRGLLEEPDRARAMALAAYETFSRRFTAGKMTLDVQDLYHEILGRRREAV